MKRSLESFSFFVVLFLISCTSPNKLYKKAKYEKAFKSMVKQLEKEKASRSDLTLLGKTLNELDKEKIQRIESLEAGDFEDQLVAFEEYSKLIEYHEQYQKITNKDQVKLENYINRQEQLRGQIVDVFLNAGLDDYELFEKENDKFAARDAYNNFRAAQSYGSDYEGLGSMIDLAYNNSIIYHNVYLNNANISIWDDNVFDDITRSSNEFVKINFTQMTSNNCDCDIAIQIDFINFNENRRNNSQYYSREIQDGYDTYVDTSGVTQQTPRYIEVSANYLETVFTKTARTSANVIVRKLTPNCILNGFGDYFTITSEAIEYSVDGDSRAIPFGLPSNNQRLETDSDMEQILYEEIYDRIERQLY